MPRVLIATVASFVVLVDRHPQTFVDIYQATESDFQNAIQRVYRTPSLPSRWVAERLP